MGPAAIGDHTTFRSTLHSLQQRFHSFSFLNTNTSSPSSLSTENERSQKRTSTGSYPHLHPAGSTCRHVLCFLPVGRNFLPQRRLKEDSQGTESDPPLSTQGQPTSTSSLSVRPFLSGHKHVEAFPFKNKKATFPSSYPLASRCTQILLKSCPYLQSSILLLSILSLTLFQCVVSNRLSLTKSPGTSMLLNQMANAFSVIIFDPPTAFWPCL